MKVKKGFTLVELLIVVLILAALAAIAVPRIGASAATAKTRACDTNIDLLNQQLEIYYANVGTALTTGNLDTLTDDEDYFPDGAPVCPWGTAYVIGSNDHITAHSH